MRLNSSRSQMQEENTQQSNVHDRVYEEMFSHMVKVREKSPFNKNSTNLMMQKYKNDSSTVKSYFLKKMTTDHK